jgi:hypothetical protein
VILAELVYHYRDDGPAAGESRGIGEHAARGVEP